MPLPTSSTRTPGAERRAQPGAEVIGRPGTAGADVAGAEDHLVSQDAGAAVLAVVVEFGSGGRGRLGRRHVISQLEIRPARSRMILPREYRRRRAGPPILLESGPRGTVGLEILAGIARVIELDVRGDRLDRRPERFAQQCDDPEDL